MYYNKCKDYLEIYRNHINKSDDYLKIILEIFDNNGCIDMEDERYSDLIDAIKSVRELNKD